MKPLRLALIIGACALLAPASSAQKKRLTAEQVLGSRGGARVQYFTTPQAARWAPDGKHYVIRKGGKSVWVNPETGQEQAPEGGGAEQATGSRRPGGRGRRGRSRSPLRVSNGDLYLGDPAQRDLKKLTRLTTDGGQKQIPLLSPDKAWASFVRDNNLSILATNTRSEWRVTDDGSRDLMYGILDWVYQEEIYGRYDFQGHWWSGDSKAVAFLRLDEAAVKTFTVIDHVPTDALTKERAVVPEVTKYPKAGDPNPTVGLKVAWPETREIVDIDMSGYDDDVLIVRVGWTPDSAKVLFAVQDRIQTWLELNLADPRTGEVSRIVREESDTWVNRLPFPRYLEDGSFLWFSERTGYQHIYHFDRDGHRAITSGEWQVRRIVKIGELDGRRWIWFTGTKDGAINDNLYRVDFEGGEVIRLTQGEGRHSVSLNADGSWFIGTVSTVSTPPEVRLCKGDGSSFKVLDKSQPKDVDKFVYCPTERLTIRARDGYPLDATLIRPPDFSEDRRYPIYLPTYSGPDAPSVRNSFGPNPWQQLIAQQGALILQVNVRSASGRGQAHTGLCYKQLGVQELKDLEDAVDHVVAEHGGDPDRVAIDGWSYGGFMAAYALTHSKKFSLGLAGGGVHDWRLYDTIYTERYMSTPQLNPDGYQKTSVIEAADKMHGHLVLMHGVKDDNVHVQNTMQLVHALQNAGEDDFELMLYPKARHGVSSSHRRRMLWRSIRDHLALGEVR